MSHRIRLLEECVGERLFIRDGRAVTLSEFGLRYLEAVRSALRTLPHLPLPRRRAQVQPRIKVTMLPTFTCFMRTPHLAELAVRHAEIVIGLFVSVPLYDLGLSESDVEVRFGAGHFADTVTERLFEEPSCAVASPAYLDKIGGLDTPADLKKTTLLRSALEPG